MSLNLGTNEKNTHSSLLPSPAAFKSLQIPMLETHKFIPTRIRFDKVTKTTIKAHMLTEASTPTISLLEKA
jgi:hypothetical protein